MPISRLGVANPAANTATTLYSPIYAAFVSVLVANKSTSTAVVPTVDIYVVPSGSSSVSQHGYIVANLQIGAGQAFETFKFAVNPGDVLWVKATTADISFSVNGTIQADDFTVGDFPVVFTNKTINGNVNTITVEKNNTATRPANAPVGYLRFNTEIDALEVRTSTGWKIVSAT